MVTTIQNLQHPIAIIATATTTPLPRNSNHNHNNNDGRTIAFTTPQNYAARLSHLLRHKGWKPLWCPTVAVETTPQTNSNLQRYLSSSSNPNPNLVRQNQPQTKPQPQSLLEHVSAVAFTSRTGISAFSRALSHLDKPPLSPSGDTFTISALGRDSELLDHDFIAGICTNPNRIRVLVPPVATPTGLIDSLGLGRGRRVLCPVPLVVGLAEPPVVPNFLRDLAAKGWIPVRVNGYETRWVGPECAEEVVRRVGEEEGLDAIVFTSTGEVEGLLKSLTEMGLDWRTVKGRCPGLVVAAHGPVTAAGAERLGVEVDVVSKRFDSFDGVVDALDIRWQSLTC